MQTSCATYLHCSLAWFPGCERVPLGVKLRGFSTQVEILLVEANGVPLLAEACSNNMGGLAVCVPSSWQELSFQYFNPLPTCSLLWLARVYEVCLVKAIAPWGEALLAALGLEVCGAAMVLSAGRALLTSSGPGLGESFPGWAAFERTETFSLLLLVLHIFSLGSVGFRRCFLELFTSTLCLGMCRSRHGASAALHPGQPRCVKWEPSLVLYTAVPSKGCFFRRSCGIWWKLLFWLKGRCRGVARVPGLAVTTILLAPVQLESWWGALVSGTKKRPKRH